MASGDVTRKALFGSDDAAGGLAAGASCIPEGGEAEKEGGADEVASLTDDEIDDVADDMTDDSATSLPSVASAAPERAPDPVPCAPAGPLLLSGVDGGDEGGLPDTAPPAHPSLGADDIAIRPWRLSFEREETESWCAPRAM